MEKRKLCVLRYEKNSPTEARKVLQQNWCIDKARIGTGAHHQNTDFIVSMDCRMTDHVLTMNTELENMKISNHESKASHSLNLIQNIISFTVFCLMPPKDPKYF